MPNPTIAAAALMRFPLRLGASNLEFRSWGRTKMIDSARKFGQPSIRVDSGPGPAHPEHHARRRLRNLYVDTAHLGRVGNRVGPVCGSKVDTNTGALGRKKYNNEIAGSGKCLVVRGSLVMGCVYQIDARRPKVRVMYGCRPWNAGDIRAPYPSRRL